MNFSASTNQGHQKIDNLSNKKNDLISEAQTVILISVLLFFALLNFSQIVSSLVKSDRKDYTVTLPSELNKCGWRNRVCN